MIALSIRRGYHRHSKSQNKSTHFHKEHSIIKITKEKVTVMYVLKNRNDKQRANIYANIINNVQNHDDHFVFRV